ncbi:MAG: ATP-binding protein [Brachymonas sp.]|nr:ATP-binding protein [Brachymonas sp.]
MRILTTLGLIGSAVLISACASTGGTGASVSREGPAPKIAANNTITGNGGLPLYVYSKDKKGEGVSECYDACAKNWPAAVTGVNTRPEGDFGLIIRMDSTRQWTYKGQPLYYYAQDSKAGDKKGDGAGGNWKLATK